MGVCSEDRWVPWVSLTHGLWIIQSRRMFFCFKSLAGGFF